MRSLVPRARRGETGAVAVVVALLSVVLLGSAAIVVDLGNAWARKRQAQNQADLAALAGGGLLPDANAAIDEAFDYLQDENQVYGNANFVKANFTDGNLANGEITVSNENRRLTVTAPPATVEYGFARIFGAAQAKVQARAVVEIRTPGRPLPFFIPAGCATQPGQIVLKANAQSGGSGPTPEPAPTGNTPDSNTPGLSAVTPLEIQANQTGQTLTIQGDDYYDTGNGADIVMRVHLLRQKPTGRVDIPVDVPASAVIPQSRPDLDVLTIVVPDAVANDPGVWYVQLYSVGTGTYSRSNSNQLVAFTVRSAADLPDQCGEKETGDFGLIDSPRSAADGTEITQAQQRLDLNIAEGIDHDITRFTSALPSLLLADNCRVAPANTPIPGGVLDTWNNPAGTPNCLQVQTGNTVDTTTDGLIKGGSNPQNFTGRLDVDTTDGCSPDRDSDERNLLGVSINDDVLSCFLKDDTLTLANAYAVRPPPGGSPPPPAVFTSAIVNSPRFFIVPVLHYEVNPPNGWYPLVEWRAVFITDQPSTASRGNPQAAATNGLQANAAKVSEIKVSYFYLDALPTQVEYSGETIEYIGTGPKVVRLVE